MSSPDTNQTQMTNPPSKQLKMVKIKTLYPIRLHRGKEGEEHIVTEGKIVEVTEEEAKEFCDKKYEIGHKDFSGWRGGVMGTGKAGLPGAPETKVARAVRVN